LGWKEVLEFGVIETGRTKYLRDSLKLAKILRNTLAQLVVECKSD
ncbi:26009_t:CDS:1, partial [Racocetra persica]